MASLLSIMMQSKMVGLVIERCSPTPVLVDGYGSHGEGVIIEHLC